MLSMFVNSSYFNWDDVVDHVVFAYTPVDKILQGSLIYDAL